MPVSTSRITRTRSVIAGTATVMGEPDQHGSSTDAARAVATGPSRRGQPSGEPIRRHPRRRRGSTLNDIRPIAVREVVLVGSDHGARIGGTLAEVHLQAQPGRKPRRHSGRNAMQRNDSRRPRRHRHPPTRAGGTPRESNRHGGRDPCGARRGALRRLRPRAGRSAGLPCGPGRAARRDASAIDHASGSRPMTSVLGSRAAAARTARPSPVPTSIATASWAAGHP